MKSLFSIINKSQSNSSSLIGAIQEVVDTSRRNSKRQKDWAPFKWFPNVSYVKMELSPWDEIFKIFGIKKRRSGALMHYAKHQNASMNRFVMHQLIRLKKARDSGNQKLYWLIAESLMLRSRLFYMLALQHVFPKWHRDLPFYAVLYLFKKYRNIVKEKSTSLDYKRVYIEKPGNKYRPLGVPKPEWRIYLHLVNQFLVLNLDKGISNSQHGFRPGKGTLTAWLDILKNIGNYKYVFEFDYKQFFPSIAVNKISEVLKEEGIPEHIVDRIEKINECQPKLQEKDLINETAVRMLQGKQMVKGWWEKKTMHEVLIDALKTEELIEARPDYLWDEGKWQTEFEPGRNPYREDFQFRHPYIIAENNKTSPFGDPHTLDRWRHIGVPQGAPTSPFLSILLLDKLAGDRENSRAKWIRYADDGVVMANEPMNILNTMNSKLKEANVEYSTEKSGYVVFNGQWMKPLKFLGLEFDGVTLKANTRKGSNLIFDKEELVSALRDRMIETSPGNKDLTEDPTSWMSFTKAQYFGFFMSRLYTGKWNLHLDEAQDFRIKFRKGSWCSEYQKWLDKPTRRGSHNEFLRKLVGIKLSVFNSSSLALDSALMALKDYEMHNYKFKIRKSGIIRDPLKDTNEIIEVPKGIQWEEKHPIASAVIGRGPLIRGRIQVDRSSQARRYTTLTRPTSYKSLHWIQEVITIVANVIIGLVLACLCVKSIVTTEPELTKAIQVNYTWDWPEWLMLSTMLILLLISIMCIFTQIEDIEAPIKNLSIDKIEGPMTLEDYYKTKDLLAVQALEENLMISPIGDLWVSPFN